MLVSYRELIWLSPDIHGRLLWKSETGFKRKGENILLFSDRFECNIFQEKYSPIRTSLCDVQVDRN
jgi:hypothetical protein